MVEQGIFSNFPITVYGDMEKYNETLSKGRCRIFYKGRNHNGSFITDEFAEKLLRSIPYTPVKGIYDGDDYTDHGVERTEGRIYGIVPENPNFAWEIHLDEDGKEREYACVDVLYFTALYPEASEIVHKSQSMELYKKSIKGEWQFINGQKTFVFLEGSFLGLQILGDSVQPCFEGAAFYTLYDSVKEILYRLEEYQNADLEHKQGGTTMPNLTFKVSDGQKYDILWSLLNSNHNEENGWAVEYGICEVYDDYALVRNYAESIYERVYYTKNDEAETVEITSKERCYVIDVSEEEMTALSTIKGEGTYTAAAASIEEKNATIASFAEVVAAKEETIQNLNDEFSAQSQKIEELELTISTLTAEGETARLAADADRQTIATLEASLVSETERSCALQEENIALAAYKKTIEDNAKLALIDSYSTHLSAETVTLYKARLEEYTSLEELDVRLTYEVKLANPTIFNKQSTPAPLYIPKDEATPSGLADILSRYEKKN